GSLHAAGADRPVLSAPVRAPRRFDLVGLRWRSGHGAPPVVRVRVRRDGDGWSRWFRLAPGDSGPRASDPLWTGGANLVQYRLSHAVRGLRLHFVSTRGAPPRLHAAAASGQPDVVSRSSWSGHGQCRPRHRPLLGQVEVAFVHHTDTATSYSRGDVPAMILAICRYHRDSNGWDDIGYNFLVDRFGRVWAGRAGGIDKAVVGAQTAGFNSESTGIANLGTFDSTGQTEAAIRAMARLIRWKLPLHGTRTSGHATLVSVGSPDGGYPAGKALRLNRIAGHRNAFPTDCPGDALYAQLPGLRDMTGSLEPQPAGPRATLTLERPPAELSGGRLHVKGTIAPRKRYVTAFVDRRSHGRWRAYSRTILPVADRAFDEKLTVADRGRYHVYVRFAGDSKVGFARTAGYPFRVGG
ncbi:MAG: N-acetylmuramoyl-L-alanine amidase, partial [Thermoleophilaceae bacterium]